MDKATHKRCYRFTHIVLQNKHSPDKLNKDTASIIKAITCIVSTTI